MPLKIVSAVLTAAAILIGTPQVAGALEPKWPPGPYKYVVIEQDLKNALTEFGRNINDFNLSYTDPAILDTRTSGTITLFNSRRRYTIGDLGRQRCPIASLVCIRSSCHTLSARSSM